MKSGIKYVRLIALISFAVYNYFPETGIPQNTSIDRLVVVKSERKLQAFTQGKMIKTYTISLGRNPIGAKEIEDDKKTPEGLYFILDKNPNTGYHKNLGVSYPNPKDLENAKSLGKPAGDDIKIHGIRNGMGFIGKLQRQMDWTAGCIALTNAEVDEIYDRTAIGMPIEIKL